MDQEEEEGEEMVKEEEEEDSTTLHVHGKRSARGVWFTTEVGVEHCSSARMA